MIHLFCGHDPREAIGFHVFLSSVIQHASEPVAIHPLGASTMPTGSNDFTLSRFLVPWLMGFKGRAIFADASDMLMLGDIAELDRLFDESKAVQVVKHDYKTRNPIKYLGTSLQCPNRDYHRKNWASLMLINCEHPAWQGMTPHVVEAARPLDLLQLSFIPDEAVGELPSEWNAIVDEGQAEGKLNHWTAGIPAFPHYKNAPGADKWRARLDTLLEVA